MDKIANTFEKLQAEHQHIIERLDQLTEREQLLEPVLAFLNRIEKQSEFVGLPNQRDQLFAILRYWASFVYEIQKIYPETHLRPVNPEVRQQLAQKPVAVALAEKNNLRALGETIDRLDQARALGSWSDEDLAKQLETARNYYLIEKSKHAELTLLLGSKNLEDLQRAYVGLRKQIEAGIEQIFDARVNEWLPAERALRLAEDRYRERSQEFYLDVIELVHNWRETGPEQAMRQIDLALKKPLYDERERALLENKRFELEEAVKQAQQAREWLSTLDQSGPPLSTLQRLLLARPALLEKQFQAQLVLYLEAAFKELQRRLANLTNQGDCDLQGLSAGLGAIAAELPVLRRSCEASNNSATLLKRFRILEEDIYTLQGSLNLVGKLLATASQEQWQLALRIGNFEFLDNVRAQMAEVDKGVIEIRQVSEFNQQLVEYKEIRRLLTQKAKQVKLAFEADEYPVALQIIQDAGLRPDRLPDGQPFQTVTARNYPKILELAGESLQVVNRYQVEQDLIGWQKIGAEASERLEQQRVWTEWRQAVLRQAELALARYQDTLELKSQTTYLEMQAQWQATLTEIQQTQALLKAKPSLPAHSTQAEATSRPPEELVYNIKRSAEQTQQRLDEIKWLLNDPQTRMPANELLDQVVAQHNWDYLEELITRARKVGFQDNRQRERIDLYAETLQAERKREQRSWRARLKRFWRWLLAKMHK